MAGMVEMTVQGLGSLEGGGHVAVLRERDGRRTMGVGLGESAAVWLSAQMAGVQPTRPNPHVLTLDVLQRLGARLLRVAMDDNRASEPRAYLELDAAGGIVEVACAPEDAVALAVYTGVTVMVHPALLRRSRPSGLGTEPSRPPSPRRRARPGSGPTSPNPKDS